MSVWTIIGAVLTIISIALKLYMRNKRKAKEDENAEFDDALAKGNADDLTAKLSERIDKLP